MHKHWSQLLDKDEKILWQGRPDLSLIPKRERWMIQLKRMATGIAIPLALALGAYLFSGFLSISLVGGALMIAVFWGGLLLVTYLIEVISPKARVMTLRNLGTLYAITDKRALTIIDDDVESVDPKPYFRAEWPRETLQPVIDGKNVWFETETVLSGLSLRGLLFRIEDQGIQFHKGFVCLPDPGEVMEVLTEPRPKKELLVTSAGKPIGFGGSG